MAKYNRPEDVDNAVKQFDIPEDHYCWGCPYGKAMQDRFICPFVEGSCARYPQTLMEPDVKLVSTAVHHRIVP